MFRLRVLPDERTKGHASGGLYPCIQMFTHNLPVTQPDLSSKPKPLVEPGKVGQRECNHNDDDDDDDK